MGTRIRVGLTLLGISFILMGAVSADYRAWLETRRSDSLLQLSAFATSASAQSCRYRLTALRIGPSGSAASTQQGPVKFANGRPVRLADLRLSLKPGEEVQIRLQLYRDDDLVFDQELEETGDSRR